MRYKCIVYFGWKANLIKRNNRKPELFCPEEKENQPNSKSPFFMVLNERGTAKRFIDALNQNREEEAAKYISPGLLHEVDLKEIKNIFNKKSYHWVTKMGLTKNHGMSNVAMAVGEDGFREIIEFHMVEDPYYHGRWRIVGICKE